jgi:hypothetical protein
MSLKRYPTEAEADARKYTVYRDVIAYIESHSRVTGRTGTEAQREQEQQLKVARTEVMARKELQNNSKLRQHRDRVEKLKAMAKAEITAIDDRVEVLVAAHDQLLLILVYDGTHPATAAAGGTPTVIPATTGGAPQAASGPPPAVPAVIAVDPAVIVVVDGDGDTHATRAATAAAAAPPPRQLLPPPPRQLLLPLQQLPPPPPLRNDGQTCGRSSRSAH